MRRLYVHVGLMKTGTTFLQSVWRTNHAALEAQGVYFPAGPDAPVQRHAVWDLMGRRPRGARDDRISGQWKALTDAVAANSAPTVLLSEEYLATVTISQARRVVSNFPGHDVHVIVTARDLGRVLASAWQEDVKNDRTKTWTQFVAAVRDPQARRQDPARGFWRHHDLSAVVDTWAAAAGPGRVHVVTVPPPGTPPGLLLSRVGRLVGFDPQMLTEPAPRANESLGASATEVLRRLNERLDHRLNQRQYDRVVKDALVRYLPPPDESERFVLPADHLGWATTEAEKLIDHLRRKGYDVVGDLDELVPSVAGAGRRPEEVSADAMLEASMEALTVLAEQYATAWWQRRRPDVPRAPAPLRVRATSGARSIGYRLRRGAADLADRNRVAARGMGVYLRARESARRRAGRRR